MKVKELRDLLSEYPDEAEVVVIREREPGQFAGTIMDIKVSWSIEQDTGKGSVCLWPMLRTAEIPD